MGVVLLSGSNTFALTQKRSEYIDRGAQSFDAAEVDMQDIVNAISNVSLFDVSDSPTIIIDPQGSASLSDWLQENIENIDSETVLVSQDIDKRSALYKSIKKHGEILEFTQLSGGELISWLAEFARSLDLDIDRSVLSQLVRRIGEDQQLLSSELTKLQLLQKKITAEDIEQMTEARPEDNIFRLVEMIFAGQGEKAIDYLDSLDDANSEPFYVISMLYWQLNAVAVVLSAGDRDDTVIAKENKMSPFVVSKSRSLARNISKQRLSQIYDLVLEAEEHLKSHSTDSKIYLHSLIVDVAKTVTS